MCCFDTLPDLVLDRIVGTFYSQYVVSEPHEHLEFCTKHLIPLLSVCRRFRQTVLPYMYRIVRCQLQRHGTGVDRAAAWSAHSLDCIPLDRYRHIEHFVIDASACVVDSAVLQKFMTAQQINSTTLPSIRSIVIWQYIERNRSWLISRSQDLTTVFSDYIVDNFTAVERLEYMATGTDSIFDKHPIHSLIPRLPMLRTLISTATVPPDIADLALPLTTLSVKKAIPIPHSNRHWVVSHTISQSLTVLSLHNFSLRDILLLFRQSSADTGTTAFPHLRQLSIALSVLLHGDEDTSDFDHEQFELPVVTHLRLAGDTSLCVSFQRRTLCPQLLNLEIDLPQNDAAVNFHLHDVTQLRQLRVLGNISESIPEDPRCKDVDLRPLLAMCDALRVLELRVRCIPRPCLSDTGVSFTFVLQRLEIYFPVAPGQLVKLMECLSLLLHLTVAWSEHPGTIACAGLDMPSICPALETIAVPYIFGALEDVPFTQFAELTRHVPALRAIRAPKMIANMIELAVLRNRCALEGAAPGIPRFIHTEIRPDSDI